MQGTIYTKGERKRGKKIKITNYNLPQRQAWVQMSLGGIEEVLG